MYKFNEKMVEIMTDSNTTFVVNFCYLLGVCNSIVEIHVESCDLVQVMLHRSIDHVTDVLYPVLLMYSECIKLFLLTKLLC